MSEYHVEVRNAAKSYGEVEVMRDLNLGIKDGEFCALLGPSGCGKSTLLRMICGLETVSEGAIYIGGKDVTDVPPARRRIAMVFQSYALYPHMTVRQNIGFSLSVARLPRDRIKARTDEIAAMLQLGELMDRKPSELSGGQRQRVAIGRSLVRSPEVFLFDEPLSNLDAKLRVQMRLEIAKLHQELKTTMIYVTHDQIEAMTLADRIVVLDAGRISQVGSPLELYRTPNNKFVAAFIGSPSMNFLPASVGAVENGAVRLELPRSALSLAPRVPGEAAARPAGAWEIGIRPENVDLVDPDSERAMFTGTVQLVELLGSSTIVYVDSEIGQIVAEGDGDLEVAMGDRVGLALDAARVHLFDSAGQII